MTKPPRDIGASVRARLLRLARERGEDFQLLLTRYASERLLYRLSTSRHGPAFVLKGAALFTLWTGKPHRATRDLDLLGSGDPSVERVRKILREVLALETEDDGVRFDGDSLDVGPIREEQEYGGIRARVTARIATAKVRLQVDVGFGDAITPEAVVTDFPSLLDFPAARLRAYPRETVVSEKLQAMVQLGLASSRMKDLYDLVVLSRMFEFEGESLVRV
jgi:predicted nucleotidyltransferase component of viral defense system